MPWCGEGDTSGRREGGGDCQLCEAGESDVKEERPGVKGKHVQARKARTPLNLHTIPIPPEGTIVVAIPPFIKPIHQS